MVIGDKDKLVCGDSKDRVIEKWGNPTSASPSLGQWRYDLCVIEFLDGKLNNYGGKCDFQKISNDSFEGHRILANNSEILEKELNSNQISELPENIGNLINLIELKRSPLSGSFSQTIPIVVFTISSPSTISNG